MNIRKSVIPAIAIFALLVLPCLAEDGIALNEKEYFEGPGFSFLVFHNNYQVGFQGGLQMILNDERVLDSGDLLLVPKEGQVHPTLKPLRRDADRTRQTATVFGEVEEWKMGYQLVSRTDGRSMFVTLKLDRPIDWRLVEQAGFKICLYPGTYFSKSYKGEAGSGVFPQQFTGKTILSSPSKKILVAQEDPLHSFTISSEGSPLVIVDPRQDGPETWFMFVAPFPPGSQSTELSVTITPGLVSTWRRPPVIGISQVGYLPHQMKRVILELDSRDTASEPVNIYQLQVAGPRKLVKSGVPKAWGKFLRFEYAMFDFSDVREPGVYMIEFRDQHAGPFRIADRVYDVAWHPTLEYFLPVQMCHVSVKEGNRTWHGPCHLDDALQAPAHKKYIDGYEEGSHDSKYGDNEHIPGLDWGGWHDAGDFDLPAGSIAMTTLPLALAEEEFHPSIDETTIRREQREVLLHAADGKPDILQQIEFGVEGMLASFRVAGYIFPGIIENTGHAYSYLGDPVNITDNRVYDSNLKPGEVRGDRSGKLDDRWAFTNRNTGLQYQVAQALAAASRALKTYHPGLAEEALRAAEQLWEYEQTHPPKFSPNSYAPEDDGGFHSQELAAAAELLITTGASKYRDRLIALLPVFKGISGEQFGTGPGWVLARVMPKIDDSGFRSAVSELAAKWATIASKRASSNPWGVQYAPRVSNPDYKLETRSGVLSEFVWGEGWNLQDDAFRQFYVHRQFPDLFAAEPIRATVDFVLGAHPANNRSLVSGVGIDSALIAYGFNRADWSHIPGGVISGPSLVKPDYMELKKFPFLWYQTEYVISGAATYIFDLLAAQSLK
jgi:endoglucanase